jgi:carbamoyltransferase
VNVLAINFNHDGSAALAKDGVIAGYVNTERLSRRKKHPGVRESDLCNLLNQANLTIDDVDLVLLLNLNLMDSPDVPTLHGSDLKETWPEFWLNHTFTRVRLLGRLCPCVLSHLHHEYHAWLAYSFGGFDSAVSLACDPTGTHAFFIKNGKILPIDSSRQLIGAHVYDQVAVKLFGTGIVGAGKLMGLAPYGAAPPRPVDYAALRRHGMMRAYGALVALSRESPIIVEETGKALNATLAYHAQAFLEYDLTVLLKDLYEACLKLEIEPNLCLSGGTALNSTANQRCFANSPFRQLYLHPACGDDGTPLGAVLRHWDVTLNQPKRTRSNREAMYGCRTYDHEIAETIGRYHGKLSIRETANEVQEAAELIADGQVIGWFQGASEIGPRALGNRSILADPRNPDMRDYLNRAIKKREAFRPFAPSILREHAGEWFGIPESPFMLRTERVRREGVPAVTHVDGTSRFQTVSRDDNPRFFDLVSRFHTLTQVPMVLNTSFNGDGEPIVETPEDAIQCMVRSKLDALVFPGFVLRP